MKQIGVIGSGRADDETGNIAYAVGKEIGRKANLVCGGRGGVMREAARGCKETGGETIGIIPSNKKEDANEYIDHVIVTGLGVARNAIVVKSSDALISIKGGYGTLSEIAMSKKIGKEVVGIGSGFSELMTDKEHIKRAKNPKEAVKLAIESLG